jgi:MEDS: MEthanogen/methylotroph, DcmR Sensory domain
LRVLQQHGRPLPGASLFHHGGLPPGERAFHIVDPERREDHLKRLGDARVAVEAAMSSGQLEVRTWQETYLREDQFDQGAMLALARELLGSNGEAMPRRMRMVAQMEWALLDRPGVDDLIEYKSRLNELLPEYDHPVICAYDLSRFRADTALNALRTHPLVIIGGLIQENPFYVEPDQLLRELRERRSSVEGTGTAR